MKFFATPYNAKFYPNTVVTITDDYTDNEIRHRKHLDNILEDVRWCDSWPSRYIFVYPLSDSGIDYSRYEVLSL